MFQPGDEIDIWVVEKALGQGGMGSVYRCHNRSAKRILAAIKVLDGSLNRIPKIQARFIREAEILFALDHPSIVKVRNVRIDLDPPYLEMEFVDGPSLEGRLERGPVPMEEAVAILREMASALAYLHARNIRHRDLKPANIVCQQNGHSKLVDFGIATEMDGATISEHGQAMGSASYVPPEWARPGELDSARWDLYALGLCIWECLTGRIAFPMPTEGSPSQRFLLTVAQKQSSLALDPGAEFPVALRALVHDLTHPDPTRRVPTAEALCARLDDLDLATVDPSVCFDLGLGGSARDNASQSGHTMVPDEGAERPVGGVRKGVREDGRRVGATSLPTPTALSRKRTAEPTFDDLGPGQSRPPTGTTQGAVEGTPTPARRPNALRVGVTVGAALAIAGLAGVAWWLGSSGTSKPSTPSTATARALSFVVSGVPAGVPVSLALDGNTLTDTQGRWGAGFATVGPHTLVATVGADCGADGAAAWCDRVTRQVSVKPGDGLQSEVLTLPAPARRDVTLVGGEASATITGVGPGAKVAGGAMFAGLMPGSYTVTYDGGGTQVIAVPWADGPLSIPATYTAAAVTPTAHPPGPSDPTGPRPMPAIPPVATPLVAEVATAGGAAAHAVTNSSFAPWLAAHPEWLRDAAVAAGQAEDGYLKGWTGAEAPAGQGERGTVNVSWAAAAAYCKGHGGLADASAPPTTWTEGGSQPWHEYRQQAGAPAWRRADGTVSTAVSRSQSNAVTGFRCAR